MAATRCIRVTTELSRTFRSQVSWAGATLAPSRAPSALVPLVVCRPGSLSRCYVSSTTPPAAGGAGDGTATPAKPKLSAAELRARASGRVKETVNNLLYNIPTIDEAKERHVLSVLVENESGVLAKISGLIAARGFNIDSLAVSTTQVPRLSRMTIVLRGKETQMEQARRQLADVVHVWGVLDYTNTKILERELLLIKVSTNSLVEDDVRAALALSERERLQKNHVIRQQISELTKLFGGRVLDIGTAQVVVELSTWSRRVDAFINMMEPYGIIEASRSGVMAMPRSPVTVSKAAAEEHEMAASAAAVNLELSDLPPS